VGATDEVLLLAAAKDRLTLVTYDLRTIPNLLAQWEEEEGVWHAGVLFVDHRTIRPNDFGGLIRALALFWKDHHRFDWRDRVSYLPPEP
jgi:hypothetical protein